MTAPYPFAAIVGQDDLKLALTLCLVDPRIGGVMAMGHRGTGKSTAVRGIAALAPPIETVAGCRFQCEIDNMAGLCAACTGPESASAEVRSLPVVDLPLGATEDRVIGALDLEAALVRGEKVFEPGLLARAHRGFLYIDEANLLEDHLVDLLLDVAAAGTNIVERESITIAHPARVMLVGSGNPEEGELRPQLLDRFGLYIDVTTEADPELRAEIVRRRLAFDEDPAGFIAAWDEPTVVLRDRIAAARQRVVTVKLPESVLGPIVALNAQLEIDGHRGELTITRAARAFAALEARDHVEMADAARVAPLALSHRLRRDPLAAAEDGDRLAEAIGVHLG